MLSAVLRAAPSVDAEIVIVRPNRPMLRADTLPANVRTTGWLPLRPALAVSTALVNHGGAGSVYDGFSAGVPQLVTPAPGDRAWNAGLVAARGAGLSVAANRITVSHLTQLVTDAALAVAAREVAAELTAMPSVSDVAAQVLALAGGR
jgi:UDP:flavonoid glycosyltransferase YjiC (YdhE family)